MLLLGDCKEVLKQYPDNHFDLIVTDPPYGISFMGKDWDKALPDKEVWKECFRVLKEGKLAFIMCSPRQDVLSRMIVNLEDAGFRTNYTSIYWTFASGFPKAANISKMIDKKAGVTREIIGKATDGKGTDSRSGIYQMNNGKSTLKKEYDITKPATEEAKKMEGAYIGFQPKPAVEVILVVSKGKTLTWLDSCRIPYNDNDEKGRFPANLTIEDNVLADYSKYFDLDAWSKTFPFLICPKASRSERNKGCEDLDTKAYNMFECNPNFLTGSGKPRNLKMNNSHPTVKPIKLLSYLITLGSREGDLVLDPFVGSGTSYLAATQLNRKCIGIEINPEYLEIATSRLQPYLEQMKII